MRAARATSQELGATPLTAELEGLGRRGNLDLDGAADKDDEVRAELGALGLTPREIEVMGCLADGKSNPEIATELFITQKTASAHVSNILRKLGVRNRGEATAFAHRIGAGRPGGT